MNPDRHYRNMRDCHFLLRHHRQLLHPYRPGDHPLDNASRRPAADRRGTGVRDGVQVVEQRRNQDPITSLPSNP